MIKHIVSLDSFFNIFERGVAMDISSLSNIMSTYQYTNQTAILYCNKTEENDGRNNYIRGDFRFGCTGNVWDRNQPIEE